jgi:2-phosphoglycerate kinase
LKNSTVFLIGGAPGVGKTTLGCALAAKLGIASVTIDDLMTVAQTVTTPETHPGLHIMRKAPHLEYFTDSSLSQLKADANVQHEATWPFVKSLILKRATWDPSPIVIDG